MESRSDRISLTRLLLIYTMVANFMLGGTMPVREIYGNTLSTQSEADGSSIDQVPISPNDKKYRLYQENNGRVTIIGRDIILDDADSQNLLHRFNGKSLTQLTIYAETLTISTEVHVPSTYVYLRVKELRFEGGPSAVLSTKAHDYAQQADQLKPGRDGRHGGSIIALFETFYSDEYHPRLILDGGKGQDGGAGADGVGGYKGPSLLDAKPGLKKCRGGDLVPVDGAAPLTWSNIWAYAITEDAQPIPSTDAKPGGRPGEGGNAGDLIANQPVLAWYTSFDGGRAGELPPGGLPNGWRAHSLDTVYPGDPMRRKPGYYYGGSAGSPFNIIKLKVVAECALVKAFWYWPWEEENLDGKDAITPEPKKPMGKNGKFMSVDHPMPWYHPYVSEMAVEFARDAYRAGFRDIAEQELITQLQRMEKFESSNPLYWFSEVSTEGDAIRKLKDEIQVLLQRLASGSDYYGNPSNWVPLISLETTKGFFETEVKWALSTLFVSEWLLDEQKKIEDKRAALAQAQTDLDNEIERLEIQQREARLQLPDLKVKAERIQVRTDELQAEIKRREEELHDLAKNNLEGSWFKKVLGVIGKVVNAAPIPIPGVKEVAQGVIGGMELITGINSDAPLETVFQAPNVVSHFLNAASDIETHARDAEKKRKDHRESDRTGGSWITDVRKLMKGTSPIFNELQKHRELLKKTQVPQSKLEAELARLKASDTKFNRLTDQAENLVKLKGEFTQKLSSTLEMVSGSIAQINEHLLTQAKFYDDINRNSDLIMDARTVLALRNMHTRAMDRLRLYQYGLSKAFSYRRLYEYPGEINLTQIMSEIKEIVSNNQNGRLSESSINWLYTIYRDELSAIAEATYINAIHSRVPRNFEVTLALTPEEMAILNAGEEVEIDLWEEGTFDGLENVRIVDLSIDALEAEFSGSPGSFGYVLVDINHAGFSRIWFDGQVYVYQHYSGGAKGPINWNASYDLLTGRLSNGQQDLAEESILRTFLPDSEGQMLFSRPSAWGGLRLKRTVRSEFDVDVELKDILLRVIVSYGGEEQHSWQSYRDQQDIEIHYAYNEYYGREPTVVELAHGRLLLDSGYSINVLASPYIWELYPYE